MREIAFLNWLVPQGRDKVLTKQIDVQGQDSLLCALDAGDRPLLFGSVERVLTSLRPCALSSRVLGVPTAPPLPGGGRQGRCLAVGRVQWLGSSRRAAGRRTHRAREAPSIAMDLMSALSLGELALSFSRVPLFPVFDLSYFIVSIIYLKYEPGESGFVGATRREVAHGLMTEARRGGRLDPEAG